MNLRTHHEARDPIWVESTPRVKGQSTRCYNKLHLIVVLVSLSGLDQLSSAIRITTILRWNLRTES